MNKEVYIAAPFFNDAQRSLVCGVEDILRRHEISFFSPRLECFCPPDASTVLRTRTFGMNLDALNKVALMIVVLDWLPEAGTYVCLRYCTTGKEKMLNVPDAGTIFELGYARALSNVTLLGLRTRHRGPVNLMLAQSLHGIANTLCDLEACVERAKNFKKFTQHYNWLRAVNETTREWKGTIV